MIQTIKVAVIDGYESHQTDFLAQLNITAPEDTLAFTTNIIEPLLAVLSSPDQSAVLTITGHADRVDTPGLTREQRRQEELDASTARADSATQGVIQLIRQSFLGFLPDDFDEVQQVAILPRGAGAAVLRESSDFLSDDQRKKNRRVQMRVVRFQPV